MRKASLLIAAAIFGCFMFNPLAEAAGTFDASAMSALSAWLRSETGVTTGGGGAVTTWADQSGNSNDATSPAGFSPVLASGGVNFSGRNVINFSNSATARLNLPTTSTLGIQSSDYEIFVVGRTASSAIQFLTSDGSIENYETHINGASGFRGIPVNLNRRDVGNNGSLANNLPNIFSLRVDGDTGFARANGVDSTGLGPAQSASNTPLTLGVRASNLSLGLDGDIAEVLVFNRALTGSERASVEGYLQSEWQPFRLKQVGPTGNPVPDNIALNADSMGKPKAFAKDLLNGDGFGVHGIDDVNDGVYGNSNSWIGNSADSFVGVDLGGEFLIDGVAWGRDSDGVVEFMDRAAGDYLVQFTNVDSPNASTPDTDWTTLAEVTLHVGDADQFLRHEYEFDGVVATGVRIVTAQNGLAIDELEVFGVATPEPASIAIWLLLGTAATGYAVRRARRRGAKG